MRDISSWELVKELKNGWNLGNTLDSISKNRAAGLAHEISWGNPYVTKELVQFVKKSGFSIFRVPVTWWPHFMEGTTSKIDKAWMRRVKEVVDYAYQEGMYVILNTHHENWHQPIKENVENAKKILCDVWKQIAETFQEYDEHLIFEGLNEPRLIGSPTEWDGGTKEAREIINELNLAFVTTIRQCGGNHSKRHLMIPTHGASVKLETVAELIVPDDKVIVSVHAYVPADFAIMDEGTAVFDVANPKSTEPIDRCFDLLSKYLLQRKLPVIMGECGSRNRDGNLKDRIAYTAYYLQKAKEAGVPCIWWDNGYFTGKKDLFGILRREELFWEYPEIVELLVR